MLAQNLNTKQAASYLSSMGCPFKAGTLEIMRTHGRGPEYKRIGRRVFYTKVALDAFLEGETVKTVDSMEG